jgi:hypothetical protein
MGRSRGEPAQTADGKSVQAFGLTPVPSDVALLHGQTFAQRVAEEVDQTGVRMLEARALEPVEWESRG